MENEIIIYGIGETARLAYEYFTHDSNYKISHFTVDDDYVKQNTFCNLSVKSLSETFANYKTDEYMFFVACGSGHLNRDRTKMYSIVKQRNYKCVSYISSKAFVWHDVEIGENCFILENNVLQSGVKIGNNTTLWSGNHIGHLSQIKNNVFITSHCVISGNCTVGDNVFMGVNAAIADGVTIAKDSFIGMGAVINKNTEENSLYVGNPAVKKEISAQKFCRVRNI